MRGMTKNAVRLTKNTFKTKIGYNVKPMQVLTSLFAILSLPELV